MSGEHEKEQRKHLLHAVKVNVTIALITILTGTFGSSTGVLGEALHDGADAFSHSLDLLGHGSGNVRSARRLRQISALTITGAAGWFAYRSGVELFEPQKALAWYTGPVAVGAAAANWHVSRTFDHDHDHSNGNYAGATTHARVDSLMSPVMAAGVLAAQLAHVPQADEVAGIIAGVGTVVGNLGATRAAFKPETHNHHGHEEHGHS